MSLRSDSPSDAAEARAGRSAAAFFELINAARSAAAIFPNQSTRREAPRHFFPN
jgi:hypothetical protein